MASPKKRSSDVRKFRTRHKYRGKRRRTLPKATAMDDAPDAPISDRPNADTEPRDSGCEIDAAVEFISASQKMIGFFESEPRPVGAPTVNTMLCEIGALTALVAGSACPTCRERKVGVREAAGKRKGLSAFLELCCENSDCPESTLSSTHTQLAGARALGNFGRPRPAALTEQASAVIHKTGCECEVPSSDYFILFSGNHRDRTNLFTECMHATRHGLLSASEACEGQSRQHFPALTLLLCVRAATQPSRVRFLIQDREGDRSEDRSMESFLPLKNTFSNMCESLGPPVSPCCGTSSLPALSRRASRRRLNALDGTKDDALWESGDSGRGDDSQSDFSTSDSD
ncbi:hypothetical protein HPB52_001526 [Rhipicephalus sanguineus]|uniref:Uncharacterized protein n=1 Tax=Rhipicephalus sanguineus TaxID=34632 RepID=A0A9D4T2F3_RHISA|nr:hypothetical protein HPB52_001526 [Rhipicephalus sanguineus]